MKKDTVKKTKEEIDEIKDKNKTVTSVSDEPAVKPSITKKFGLRESARILMG